MKIELKKATTDDWQEILNFEKEAASYTFHAMTTEQEIKDFFVNNNVFFIVDGDETVGAIGYEEKQDSNYISELIVGSNFRGHGYGFKALEELLKTIGNRVCELHTHPENSKAIIVYLKAGFKIKDWKDNFFGDGEPRIILVRDK